MVPVPVFESNKVRQFTRHYAPRGHMSTSRVYEPIYTVKNLYNFKYNVRSDVS